VSGKQTRLEARMSAMQASIRYTDLGVHGGMGVDKNSWENAKKRPLRTEGEEKRDSRRGLRATLGHISICCNSH
jgi:hypothetical protein